MLLTRSGRADKIEGGEPPTALKAEIKDNKLFAETDLEKPTLSSFGKTLAVAGEAWECGYHG